MASRKCCRFELCEEVTKPILKLSFEEWPHRSSDRTELGLKLIANNDLCLAHAAMQQRERDIAGLDRELGRFVDPHHHAFVREPLGDGLFEPADRSQVAVATSSDTLCDATSQMGPFDPVIPCGDIAEVRQYCPDLVAFSHDGPLNHDRSHTAQPMR